MTRKLLEQAQEALKTAIYEMRFWSCVHPAKVEIVEAAHAISAELAKPAQKERKPMHEDQIDAAIEAWFANDIVAGPRPFSKRMQAALDAATRNTGFPPPSGELSRSMGGRSSEFDGEYP